MALRTIWMRLMKRSMVTRIRSWSKKVQLEWMLPQLEGVGSGLDSFIIFL